MIISESLPGAGWLNAKPEGMFITDFDGTLRRSDDGFSPQDLAALEELGSANIVRVIATGRSLASFRSAVTTTLPIDYIVFSSGAGVVTASEWKLVRKTSLSPEQVSSVANLLIEAGYNFTIHKPVPGSHIFAYHAAGVSDTDFERRLSYSKDHSWPLEGRHEEFGPASQFVAIVPGSEGALIFEEMKMKLKDFSIIRTTSPLDHQSAWIEIFPKIVSKGLTTAWLAEELGVSRQNTLFVGNDFNDQDILEWAKTSYVVANSPAELKERFPQVASNDNGGVAEAIRLWLSENRPGKK